MGWFVGRQRRGAKSRGPSEAKHIIHEKRWERGIKMNFLGEGLVLCGFLRPVLSRRMQPFP